MKFYIVFFVFCVALAKSNYVKDKEDAEVILNPQRAIPTGPVVKKMIEELRDNLILQGWNDITFDKQELPINLESLGITGNVVASGDIRGLLGFKVKKLIGLLNYKYELEWGVIDVNIEPYDLQGFVHMIQVFGKGKLSATIENFNVAGKFTVNYKLGDPTATLKSIEIGLTLPEGPNNKFEVTGWLNDETRSLIITEFINENLQEVLTTFKPEISAALAAIIMEFAKDIEIPVSV